MTTTDYFDPTSDNCSRTFESATITKRRRIMSDELSLENDYSVSDNNNFQSSETASAKASSSSIHEESITNLSNSHSTPEDTFSEIVSLSSPISKPLKPDLLSTVVQKIDIKQSSSSSSYASSNYNNNNFNLQSIDDTIELVLSKIRDENNHQTINSVDYSGNSASNLSRMSLIDHDRLSKGIIANNNTNNYSSYSKPVAFPGSYYPPINQSQLQQMAAVNYSDFNNKIIDYSRSNNNTKDNSSSNNNKYAYYNPSSYQNSVNNPAYRQQQFTTNSHTNSYLNQPFFKTDSIHNYNQNYYHQKPPFPKRNVYFDPIYHQQHHHHQQPPPPPPSPLPQQPPSHHQHHFDDDNNGLNNLLNNHVHLYKDNTNSKIPNYNLSFKTPQNSDRLIDQTTTSSVRKKRILTSSSSSSAATSATITTDSNCKLTPNKRRKMMNQFSSSTNMNNPNTNTNNHHHHHHSINNNYEELIRKLKIASYNSLLMNPTMSQSMTILSPKGFVENNSRIASLKQSIKYRKYRSALYRINRPKSFPGCQQKQDRFLADYIEESDLSVGSLLSQRKTVDIEEFPDIISASPPAPSVPPPPPTPGHPHSSSYSSENRNQSFFHHLTSESVIIDSDPRSPELTNSFSRSRFPGNQQFASSTDLLAPTAKPVSLNHHKNHFVTPIVSYSETETKLITELHSTKSQELNNRNYTQFSGSFLKRTKINGKSFSNIHIEEAVSIASLSSASKNRNTCYYCYSFLSGFSCVRKSAKLFGIDSNDELMFCSSSCYSNFKSFNNSTGNADCNNPDKAGSNSGNSNNNSTSNNSLQCTKVLIKTTPYKPPKNYKKVCDFEQYVRRRFPSEGGSAQQTENSTTKSNVLPIDSMKKRLLGVNYSYFKANESLKTIYKDIEKTDQNLLLKKYSCSYRGENLTDQRQCILCHNIGDGDEDICGRLINIDADNWVHLNCGLWCFDVFETVSGSLMEVDSSLHKAIKTVCSFCSNNGAGIQCYRSKCTCVYHVPCAYKIGCIFYTDRGMYCPNHAVLNHPMHLPSLRVERRVNIFRDESALIAGMVTEDQDVKIKFRTGSLTLNNIGQLLPEQLISGRYNSSSIIYPIGFHSTRIYWSSTQINKRCKYECFIDEDDDMPLFKMKFLDQNGCEIVLTDRSCDKLWKTVLNKIAKLRQDSSLTRLFPAYLSGEQLYGLTEPQIIRVIESLPGVEMIKNYAFKFGKMQLITEMPLAINPTGSARTEPKLRTYVRRTKEDHHEPSTAKLTKCGILKAKSTYQPQPALYDSTNFNKTALLNSKTQQYKRLKYEWMNNVILSRSKIQGLGLFAAKDFEKSTMIIEYIGEIIRNEVGNAREKLYQARNNSIYMFRLNEDVIIDATVNGGLARYINHSCNPNCVAETLSLDCGSRIIITTRQIIERGEELTYDYKFDFEDNKADRIPCLCGSINCRKWMN